MVVWVNRWNSVYIIGFVIDETNWSAWLHHFSFRGCLDFLDWAEYFWLVLLFFVSYLFWLQLICVCLVCLGLTRVLFCDVGCGVRFVTSSCSDLGESLVVHKNIVVDSLTPRLNWETCKKIWTEDVAPGLAEYRAGIKDFVWSKLVQKYDIKNFIFILLIFSSGASYWSWLSSRRSRKNSCGTLKVCTNTLSVVPSPVLMSRMQLRRGFTRSPLLVLLRRA